MKLPTGPIANAAAALVLSSALIATPPAIAAPRTIGEMQTSGLVFKDTLRVEGVCSWEKKGACAATCSLQPCLTVKCHNGASLFAAFEDPKVAGVQLYLSDFQRPVTEKLAKGDIFSDPSQGGLTCSHRGQVRVLPSASRDKTGEEVFSESRSLIFKSLKVRRLVDQEGGSVVYAVYSQRLDKNEDSNNSRFKSNLCAVPVDIFEDTTASAK